MVSETSQLDVSTWKSHYTIVVATVVILLGYVYHQTRKHTWKWPPGPPSLPVLGSSPFLGKNVLESLAKMKKKYGDVFTISFPRPTVVLNSHHAIKEAFVDQANAFLGQPQDSFFTKEVSNGLGVVSSQGNLWSIQRKFSHKILRELGMGKNVLEINIHEEIHNLLQNMQKHENKAINPAWLYMTAVSNVISSICYGNHHAYDDYIYQNFLKKITEDLVTVAGPSSIISLFPWLRYVPGDIFGYQSCKKIIKSIKDFLMDYIKEHMETFNPNETRDFIDAFIAQMKKDEAAGSERSTFQEEQLLSLTIDLFLAGSETTTTTLRWAMVLMLNHPEVQAKIQKEIYQTVGTHRLPSMRDKSDMPYTEAVLLEIQRFASIVALGVPHETCEDVQILGYTIPKGTQVISNIYAAHRNPDDWDAPEKFNPSRFLDANGKVDKKEKMISFSMGKRVCLGESLARMEVFLFFTSVLQRYTITLPKGEPLPPLKGKFPSGIHAPQDGKVMFKPADL